MRPMEALTWASFAANAAFAAAHGVLGFASHSWWLITLSVYYALLSTMRFALLRIENRDADRFVRRFTGGMLIAISVCFAGTVILCAERERGVRHHEILMIAIALYAFIKAALGIVNLVKAIRHPSSICLCLRNISFEDALMSICSSQRSMLVSFGDMAPQDIVLFNILTGSGACIIVFLLGLNLIGGRRTTMVKSKIITASKAISEKAARSYQKIEKTVVDSYRKVEEKVTGGYTKIEDKFVDHYLTREGETVEEAKARLKKEKNDL